MKKLVVGNWKMLPGTLAEAEGILARVDEWLRGAGEHVPDIVVCPSFVYLEEVAKRLQEGRLVQSVSLGTQDIALSDDKAQTGEVGGAQLAALGVRYVIIGHSERRWKLGESEETVNRKLKTTLQHGMVPIVCLGERTQSGEWQGELSAQTATTFAGLTADSIGTCLIAYEPVWAISTNPGAKPDTPASAVQAMGVIRDTLTDHFDISHPTFLYGGSVTSTNAGDFLSRSEVAGVLVGGASVRADEFCEILSTASL